MVSFSEFLSMLAAALSEQDGLHLAYLLRPTSTHAKDLVKAFSNPTRQSLAPYEGSLVSPWDDIAISYVLVVNHIAKNRPANAFKEHCQLVSSFFRYFTNNTGWTLPALFAILRDLRDIAYDADAAETKTECMEEAARIISKAFTYCVTDRTSPPSESRKWGVYYVVGLIMKCYFRVRRIALSRNILRALEANKDVPPLKNYPRAHQVTYRYYIGLIAFLNEDFEKAEKELTLAFYGCHVRAQGNRQRILSYLIPLRILRGHLPSDELLERYPVLAEVYLPFISAIRKADIKAYDDAMLKWERKLVELNTWLIIERARELVIRGLFRKVWILLDRRTRIPIKMFHCGIRVADLNVDTEEVECYLANMIYKGFIRGYISHEKQTVVLAASGAFPRVAEHNNLDALLLILSTFRLGQLHRKVSVRLGGPHGLVLSNSFPPTPIVIFNSMGNTPSSPTNTLRRDPSVISGPRSLGRVLTRSRSNQLGPELVISPFISPSSPTGPSEANNAGRETLNKRRIIEAEASVTSRAVRHGAGHQRSLTCVASQSSLGSNVSAIDVRRSRSANAAGPSKADRSAEYLAEPPPYSPIDPSTSNVYLPHIQRGFLDAPNTNNPRREKGHHRTASEEVPGLRRYPTGETDASEDEPEEPIPEEYGYGVGSGMRSTRGGFRYNRMRRLPPLPTDEASSQAPGDEIEDEDEDIVASPTSSNSASNSIPPPPNIPNRPDPLELLKQYNTIFIVDDSASMVGERWSETREALASLADIAAKYDTDGIDVHFLNAARTAQGMRSAESVKRQFDSIEPQGISLLARRLEELLNDYITELEDAQRDILRGDLNALRRIKPVNYIILTDGVPTDDPEPVIIQAARRLDRGNLPVYQVGIQFVQVGDDPRATEALRELDDDLAKEYGIRDIVDTTPYNGGPLDPELLIKILLGGINRRVDKKGASSII